MREPFFAPLGLLRLAMVVFSLVVMMIWGHFANVIISDYGLRGFVVTMVCLFGLGYLVDRGGEVEHQAYRRAAIPHFLVNS
jgi:hypothetical protein